MSNAQVDEKSQWFFECVCERSFHIQRSIRHTNRYKYVCIWKWTLYNIDYIDAHEYSDMDVKRAGFTLMTTAAAAAASNAKTRISYRKLDCILSISVNINSVWEHYFIHNSIRLIFRSKFDLVNKTSFVELLLLLLLPQSCAQRRVHICIVHAPPQLSIVNDM